MLINYIYLGEAASTDDDSDMLLLSRITAIFMFIVSIILLVAEKRVRI
jgi:hypothetical protein